MATGTIGAGSKCYVSIKDIEPSSTGSTGSTWKLHSTGHECREFATASETASGVENIITTFDQCKTHCSANVFMDYKVRDGRTDDTHYCICSDTCTLDADPKYDVYCNGANCLAPALTPASWRELSTCDATMVATPQSKGEEWTLLVKKDATDASPVWQHASVDINVATFGGSKVSLQFRGVKVRGHAAVDDIYYSSTMVHFEVY